MTALELWFELSAITVNEKGEIQEPFLHFPAGTNRFKIWSWFEETFEYVKVGDWLDRYGGS